MTGGLVDGSHEYEGRETLQRVLNLWSLRLAREELPLYLQDNHILSHVLQRRSLPDIREAGDSGAGLQLGNLWWSRRVRRWAPANSSFHCQN
jgi:hypothetical protein